MCHLRIVVPARFSETSQSTFWAHAGGGRLTHGSTLFEHSFDELSYRDSDTTDYRQTVDRVGPWRRLIPRLEFPSYLLG
jgi:hypothetical protein